MMAKDAGSNKGWKRIIHVGLGMVILTTAGCFSAEDVITEFTIISTRSENAALQLGARVQGESCTQLLFGMIPVTGDPQATPRQAIERALDTGKAKFLVDGIASEQTTGVPPIFHRFCYIVEGTAANPPSP